MEIRSIQIDFDRDILKINGNECKTSPVIVSLPGLDGWQLQKRVTNLRWFTLKELIIGFDNCNLTLVF